MPEPGLDARPIGVRILGEIRLAIERLEIVADVAQILKRSHIGWVLHPIKLAVSYVLLKQAHDASEARLRHPAQTARRAAVPLDELGVVAAQAGELEGRVGRTLNSRDCR